jgi:hypothetical protein
MERSLAEEVSFDEGDGSSDKTLEHFEITGYILSPIHDAYISPQLSCLSLTFIYWILILMHILVLEYDSDISSNDSHLNQNGSHSSDEDDPTSSSISSYQPESGSGMKIMNKTLINNLVGRISTSTFINTFKKILNRRRNYAPTF